VYKIKKSRYKSW